MNHLYVSFNNRAASSLFGLHDLINSCQIYAAKARMLFGKLTTVLSTDGKSLSTSQELISVLHCLQQAYFQVQAHINNVDKEKCMEGYLGYETRYNDLRKISNEVGAFNTEHAGLLKTRFKSVVDVVTKIIKPMIPQWREYVIKTEDKEKVIANLLQK